MTLLEIYHKTQLHLPNLIKKTHIQSYYTHGTKVITK